MRKGLFVGVVIAIVLLAVGMATAQGTVKIGYLAALTGDWAYGQTEVKAAQLAAEEINAKGGVNGIKIEIVPYDFRTRAEDAVNAVRRMIEQDKVHVIIGANTSGINIATAPIVNRAGVSQIATVATNPLVTVDESGKVRPYSFRICFTDPYQGKVLAFFAAREMGKKKAAILYDVGSEYSQGLREFFIKNFEQYGEANGSRFRLSRRSRRGFRAQLTEIRNSGADVLVFQTWARRWPLPLNKPESWE